MPPGRSWRKTALNDYAAGECSSSLVLVFPCARGRGEPRAGNSVEIPNHSETGLANVFEVRREPCEAGGRSAPSGL